MPDVSREAWLQELTDRVRPRFAGLEIPVPHVRIGVGYTSKGARSTRIGECWHPAASEDGVSEIFLHPGLARAEDVSHVLVHELIHAAVGIEAKHGARFKRPALALGLAGKMTATVPTDALWDWLCPTLDDLGPYPHAVFKPRASSTGPKQTTRMIKCECPGCGYLVRTTAKWIEVAVPACPVCELSMLVA